MRGASAAFTLSIALRPAVHPTRAICNKPVTALSRTHRLHTRLTHTRQPPRCCASRLVGEQLPSVSVRRAGSSDISTASRVLACAFTEDLLLQEGTSAGAMRVVLPLFELITRVEVSAQLRKRVRHSRHAILVAEVDGRMIGCAEVGVLDMKRLTRGGEEIGEWGRSGEEVYVGNVGVLREHRGRGVGRKLLEEAGLVGQEWGLDMCVWLCVEAKNVGAVRFYEKLGFRCVAQEPRWFDEIGKRRRLFLCNCKGLEVGKWGNAKVVGGKLGVLEYLRYCLYDLRRRRERDEDGR